MDYNKNLAYFCIFCKKDYVELFKLLMVSVKLYSKTNGIDFLVFTSKEFESDIQSISEYLDIPIQMKFFDFTTGEEASCARLFLYDYEYIERYDKIMYIDTDIIIQQDLTTFFKLEINNKIYALGERTIEGEWHGGWFFDFTKIDKHTSGINAGVLLFKNSKEVKDIFQDIISHISERKQKKERMPECWDQPFVNYHIIKNNLADSELMKDYIFLTHLDYPISPLNNTKLIINHFYSKTSISKLQQMKYHMTHLLTACKKVLISDETIISNILYKQYKWESGRIIFHKDNVIITSWGRGTYKLLSNYIAEATWQNKSHTIIFNKSYTKYTSIRNDDINIEFNTIDTSLQDTIPVSSISLKPKNLVYFCAFHNKGYLDLLKILLCCLKMFSKIESIDFLIFTSESFRSTVEQLSDELNIPIQIQTFNFTTQHEAGCARLFIFNYKDIDKYDKILYMDTDITIQNDLSRVFDLTIEDKVYAIQEYDINGEGHGAWFFDFSKFDPSTPAINSGVLLFQNTLKIRRIFNDINNHIANLKGSGSIIPNCMDQSFIVYHLFRNDACNSSLMKSYVYLSEHNPPPNPEAPTDLTIVHFVWPIGNTAHKLNRMTDYTKKLLNNYGSLCNFTKQGSVEGILNKKYTWNTSNSHGKIEFLDNDLLITTWGNGIYKQLDQYTFNVSWKSFSHIIKMDSMYNSYIGLNLESIQIIKGSILVNAT